MNLVRNSQKRSSGIFVCVSIFLFFSLFVRMYSYLDNTSFQNYNFWLLLISEVLCIGAIIPRFGKLGRVFSEPSPRAAVLLWIWMCLSTIMNENDVLVCVQNIATQSFWIITFIFFSVYLVSDNRSNEIFIRKLGIIFLVISGLYYIFWVISGGDKYATGSINTVYYCIMLTPLIFSARSKLVRVLIVAIVIVAVFCSGKRTAFVAIGLAVLLPLLISDRGKKKKRIAKILSLVGVALFACVLYILIDNVFEITLFDRLRSIVEDDGSGRGYIYSEVYRCFNFSSVRDKLVGSGFNAVARDKIIILINDWDYTLEYTSAHNDYLEVLYDYGIIGAILYAVFLIQVVRTGFRMYMNKSRNFKLYLSTFIVFVTMSLTSHLILYPTYIMFLMIFFSMGVKSKGYTDD